MKPRPQTEDEPLLDRINAMRDELDAFIDAKAEELKQQAANVPMGVLRNMLTVPSGGCQCRAARALLEKEGN